VTEVDLPQCVALSPAEIQRWAPVSAALEDVPSVAKASPAANRACAP
jgi:hypothetical protein